MDVRIASSTSSIQVFRDRGDTRGDHFVMGLPLDRNSLFGNPSAVVRESSGTATIGDDTEGIRAFGGANVPLIQRLTASLKSRKRIDKTSPCATTRLYSIAQKGLGPQTHRRRQWAETQIGTCTYCSVPVGQIDRGKTVWAHRLHPLYLRATYSWSVAPWQLLRGTLHPPPCQPALAC